MSNTSITLLNIISAQVRKITTHEANTLLGAKRPGELSLNHLLAKYITNIMSKSLLDTDIEYYVDQTTGGYKGELIGKMIIPDIILHKRGTNKNNGVAIEAKKKPVGIRLVA